jgi:hypothetical protein
MTGPIQSSPTVWSPYCTPADIAGVLIAGAGNLHLHSMEWDDALPRRNHIPGTTSSSHVFMDTE